MPDYRRRTTQEAMSVRLDVNGIMAEAIGPAGVTREEVDHLGSRVAEISRSLKAQRAAGELAFYDLPYEKEVLARTKALAADVRQESDTLVVLDIGGSALGTKTLVGALETTRRVVVADNIDPWTFGRLLDGLDLKRTTFNVISKSGETAETMAQFLIVRDVLLRQFGALDHTQRVVVTTDANAGALRQVVHDEGFRDLAVPAGVGGRFSVLTTVGLFPAAVAGVRVDELLAGAAWMDARCQHEELWRNPAYLLGTLLYLADTHHHQNIVVTMPYSDRLAWFAAWLAQLWAESLGKAETLEGAPARVGQTPVAAVGATDQHSQLQLFAEGPIDKVIMMLRVEDHGRELLIPTAYADIEALGYLGGTGLGHLLNLEQRATELALVKRQRPVVTLSVPQLNAFALGQLFYLFEVAVVFAGALYRVNPLNQPGVEESKRLTYGQVGRKGFESKRTEIEAWLARKRKDYIL
ncbi:MAG: glucose-6-phosphate isomerase [Candidatus Binatia bacterium]